MEDKNFLPQLVCMAFLCSSCQSLTSNCPVEAAKQTSLLCAASGHYSGANQNRVEDKKQVVDKLKKRNTALIISKNSAENELRTTEWRRDELMQQLNTEKVRLENASKYLETARYEKSRSTAELDRLASRIDAVDIQLKYLQTTPNDNDSDYEKQLVLKRKLESELDDLLSILAE